MINNQFLSQKLFTRYTLRIDRTSSEIVARSNEPTFVRVPFFFFSFFFYLRSTDKKSSRPIGKRLEKNCAFFVHCHLQTYPLPLFALQRYTIEKLCSSFYVITYMIHTWYVLQLSIYNDRRNVKNCSSMRSKIENFSKKFYSFHECGNILFFSAKSKVFVRNAKRIFYSNIQCSFFFIWFSLSA